MTPEQIIQIAEVAHETNRAYCRTLGDWSQDSWASAPGWQRDSAIAGVRFHLENSEAGPEASHESWLAVKETEGWKYGPLKDPAKKEHPCYVPFAELPPEQQMKDFLFRAIVHAFMDAAESAAVES